MVVQYSTTVNVGQSESVTTLLEEEGNGVREASPPYDYSPD